MTVSDTSDISMNLQESKLCELAAMCIVQIILLCCHPAMHHEADDIAGSCDNSDLASELTDQTLSAQRSLIE